MATLIHLNGPAGVGKSTLAQRFVDEHHGVLNPVTSHDDVARFEAATDRSDATYREVALVIDPAEQIIRFHAKAGRSTVDEHIERYIDSVGGDAVLERIHLHFSDYLEGRTATLRVDTRGRDADETYATLLSILGGPAGSS